MGNCYMNNNCVPALNYRVLGGTQPPENHRENDIWVNTSEKITDHVFSTTAPELSEGRLWFGTSTDSVVKMNILKHDNVTVYPASCKQCVSGAWVDKTAQTFLDGKWVDWVLYLTKNGDSLDGITGGWTGTDGCLTFPNGTMDITAQTFGGSVSYGAAYTNNKIDISSWNKVEITVTGVDSGSDSNRFLCLFMDKPEGTSYDWNSNSGIPNTNLVLTAEPIQGAGTYYIDTSSLSGSYYIGVLLRGYGFNKASVTATEVMLNNYNSKEGSV